MSAGRSDLISGNFQILLWSLETTKGNDTTTCLLAYICLCKFQGKKYINWKAAPLTKYRHSFLEHLYRHLDITDYLNILIWLEIKENILFGEFWLSQNFRVSSSIASLKCDLFSDQIDLQAKKEQSQVEYSCAFFSSHFREVFLNYIRLIHDQLNFCEVSRYGGFHHFGQSPPNFVCWKVYICRRP